MAASSSPQRTPFAAVSTKLLQSGGSLSDARSDCSTQVTGARRRHTQLRLRDRGEIRFIGITMVKPARPNTTFWGSPFDQSAVPSRSGYASTAAQDYLFRRILKSIERHSPVPKRRTRPHCSLPPRSTGNHRDRALRCICRRGARRNRPRARGSTRPRPRRPTCPRPQGRRHQQDLAASSASVPRAILGRSGSPRGSTDRSRPSAWAAPLTKPWTYSDRIAKTDHVSDRPQARGERTPRPLPRSVSGSYCAGQGSALAESAYRPSRTARAA